MSTPSRQGALYQTILLSCAPPRTRFSRKTTLLLPNNKTITRPSTPPTAGNHPSAWSKNSSPRLPSMRPFRVAHLKLVVNRCQCRSTLHLSLVLAPWPILRIPTRKQQPQPALLNTMLLKVPPPHFLPCNSPLLLLRLLLQAVLPLQVPRPTMSPAGMVHPSWAAVWGLAKRQRSPTVLANNSSTMDIITQVKVSTGGRNPRHCSLCLPWPLSRPLPPRSRTTTTTLILLPQTPMALVAPLV